MDVAVNVQTDTAVNSVNAEMTRISAVILNRKVMEKMAKIEYTPAMALFEIWGALQSCGTVEEAQKIAANAMCRAGALRKQDVQRMLGVTMLVQIKPPEIMKIDPPRIEPLPEQKLSMKGWTSEWVTTRLPLMKQMLCPHCIKNFYTTGDEYDFCPHCGRAMTPRGQAILEARLKATRL